jgi:hypothetical protein
MVDWYMLFAPLILLPVFLLFAFLGCGLDEEGGAPPLTVTLRWPKSLGSDAVKLTFSATTHFEGEQPPQTESVTTTFLEPPPGESFPGELNACCFHYSTDEMITCNVVCTVFDKDGNSIGGPVTPPPKQGTIETDGSRWFFQLMPVANLENKIVSYNANDVTNGPH